MKKDFLKDESGAIFIEASFVFPVMFLVILSLIYMGNVFYIKSCVESVVVTEAVKGASYCADPMLETVIDSGVPTSAADVDVKPYASLFGNGDIETLIDNELRDEFSSIGDGFFVGMMPKYQSVEVDYKNYILCANFDIRVDYSITLPIRMLGEKENIKLNLSTTANQTVNNTATFIRDMDMVKDYMDASGVTDKIKDAFSKVKDFLGNILPGGKG